MGVYCFGPLAIKQGRCIKKQQGILLKCMTPRCTHTELLKSLDSQGTISLYPLGVSLHAVVAPMSVFLTVAPTSKEETKS